MKSSHKNMLTQSRMEILLGVSVSDPPLIGTPTNSSSDLDDISAISQKSYSTSVPIASSLSESSLQSTSLSDHGNIKDVFSMLHNDHLAFIQPFPVPAPKYEDLPPGGCPKYPIIDVVSGNELLPSYQPAAFKFGVCKMKHEWNSPYDLSPDRSWKTVVMELNSTQLNFYTISNQLEKMLWDHCGAFTNDGVTPPLGMVTNRRFSTLVTNRCDIELYEICDKLGLFDSVNSNPENCGDKQSVRFTLLNSKKDSLRKRQRLLKSYSLQYAKFGLANDYTKKSNVLRLRLEDEQFLIHFSSTEELIEWHLAISIGKDVSLDITNREVPNYRTVPRRRRNTVGSNQPYAIDASTRRSRAQSDPGVSLKSRLCSTFRSFLSKCTSLTVELASNSISAERPFQRAYSDRSNNVVRHPETENLASAQRKLSTFSGTVRPICNDFADQNDDATNDPKFQQSAASSYEDSAETHLVLDEFFGSVEEVGGEYWDVELDVDVTDVGEFRVIDFTNHSRSVTDDEKWKPTHKTQTTKRLVRNYLKCIKPLGFSDKWLNKCMVKPTTMTPLMSYYNKCFIPMEKCEVLKCCCKNAVADSTCSKVCVGAKHDCVSGSLDVTRLQVELNKNPIRSLLEYIVGSHSLIPKSIH